MCGRYRRRSTKEKIAELFDVEHGLEETHSNIIGWIATILDREEIRRTIALTVLSFVVLLLYIDSQVFHLDSSSAF